MNGAPSKSRGVRNSLRRAGNSLLTLVETRLELFTIELKEEKLSAVGVLVRVELVLVLGAVGVLVATGALSICLWEIARYLGLIGLALAALIAAAAGLLWSIRHRIRNGPTAFKETIAEFRKDGECLRRDHQCPLRNIRGFSWQRLNFTESCCGQNTPIFGRDLASTGEHAEQNSGVRSF